MLRAFDIVPGKVDAATGALFADGLEEVHDEVPDSQTEGSDYKTVRLAVADRSTPGPERKIGGMPLSTGSVSIHLRK